VVAFTAPIETATAQPAVDLPIGTVPGTVALPPEARVAVTSPFPGAAVRVFVIEGQSVTRGARLAIVQAAEPLRISADLARAVAALDLAEARSVRLAQLANEGIIARARADEAAAELTQARATLDESRRLAGYAGIRPDGTMTLRAPIAGRVAHVGVDTGGAINGIEAPFVIEAAGTYRLDLQVPERLAGRVRPGMAVQVMLSREEGTRVPVAGKIISVAPSIDPATRSVMAKASISAAPGLVSGQNVTVTIADDARQDGVSVPSRAVTLIDGASHVFVRTGEGFVPRAVTVAAEAGDRSVITNGLVAGDIVATGNITELKAAAAD